MDTVKVNASKASARAFLTQAQADGAIVGWEPTSDGKRVLITVSDLEGDVCWQYDVSWAIALGVGWGLVYGTQLGRL